jgi:hypothetical protein
MLKPVYFKNIDYARKKLEASPNRLRFSQRKFSAPTHITHPKRAATAAH